MNMVTSRGIVEPGVAIMGGADMEEVADEDQDLDLGIELHILTTDQWHLPIRHVISNWCEKGHNLSHS